LNLKTTFEGKCPNCGRIYYSQFKGEIIICDCYRYCPLCGNEMQPYKPDLAPKTYGIDGKQEIQILYVCNNHSPPFFSTQKPVEVITQ